MHIFLTFMIFYSLLPSYKPLFNFLLSLGAFMLMDSVACFKFDYQLQRGFSHFKQLYIFLGFFLLIRFGLNCLVSNRLLIRFLGGKQGELNYGFCSKDGKFWMVEEDSCVPLIDGVGEEDKEKEKLDSCTDFEGEIDSDSELDAARLRELVKIERQRVDAAWVEVAKERRASASAAEEAMAMIQRLQNDKSMVEMELRQLRRLAEEKQIHDQQVIQSLQWLLWQHQEECEEDEQMLDALNNVLYSSRDAR